MEIKIDTKKDSVEDIKKAIAFLQNFVNQSSTNEFSTSSVSGSEEGMFNIFEDDDDDVDSSDAFGNPFDKSSEEDDDDDFQIQPYG